MSIDRGEFIGKYRPLDKGVPPDQCWLSPDEGEEASSGPIDYYIRE